MDVEATFHYSFPKGTEMYSAVGTREEWILLLLDLKYTLTDPNPITQKLITELESWGM
jgi:hypothetical protein